MSDNKNDEKPTLTDRDVEILICAVRCMEGGLPKVSRNLSDLPLQLCHRSFNNHLDSFLATFLFSTIHSFLLPRRTVSLPPTSHNTSPATTPLDRSTISWLTHFRKKPDMQKFAEMAGFKNTNSASVCLNLVKKKLMGDAAPAKTPKKATPSGKRKQSTPKDAGEDDMEETPTKKMKPTPKKGGKTGAAVKDDSEEDSITALV